MTRSPVSCLLPRSIKSDFHSQRCSGLDNKLPGRSQCSTECELVMKVESSGGRAGKTELSPGKAML